PRGRRGSRPRLVAPARREWPAPGPIPAPARSRPDESPRPWPVGVPTPPHILPRPGERSLSPTAPARGAELDVFACECSLLGVEPAHGLGSCTQEKAVCAKVCHYARRFCGEFR